MKKAVALCLLVALVMYVLSGCGGNEKCTLTLTNGETKTMTAKELKEISSTDSYNWQNYKGAAISGTGKIKKIDFGSGQFKGIAYSKVSQGEETLYRYVTIAIGDYIEVLMLQEVFSGFSVGDTVRFEGVIGEGSFDSIIYVMGTESPDEPQPHIFKN